MDTNVIIGCVVVVCTIVLIITMVVWSIRTIDLTAKNGYRTARQTLKGFNGGR